MLDREAPPKVASNSWTDKTSAQPLRVAEPHGENNPMIVAVAGTAILR
jgi:hypothetical protein